MRAATKPKPIHGAGVLDPFDVMHSTRALAPHDPKLNDTRWLIGEALRRVHQRANLDALRIRNAVVGGSRLPPAEIALHASDKLHAAERIAGPAAWPVVSRIVLEGANVHDCRGFVPEETSWRADAIVADRLRVALDRIGELMGVTASGA